MELTTRDIEILETVGKLGTADTPMLRARHFPNDSTGRAGQQRTRKLADEGLLKRVRLLANDGPMQGGSLPTLFFLTEKGADVVERETGRRPPRVTHSDPKPFSLRHRNDTVWARSAFDQAAERSAIPAPVWIMEQDWLKNAKAKKGHSPSDSLVLCNRYQINGHGVSFRPDAGCHLQMPHDGGFANLLAYFEVDRSTEGHLQWKRKLGGIEAFIGDSKGWLRHWPDVAKPIIRIFVLCKTQRRISELIETTKSSAAADRIRFTTYPLDPTTVLSGEIWQCCDGELKRILRR